MSKDFILYLKDNSLIDLFFNHPQPTLSQKKSVAQAFHQYMEEFYPDNCPNQSFYLQKLYKTTTCSINFADYIKELGACALDSFESQTDFVKNYYLSYYKEKMGLTDNQAWFLERIADFMNREKDIYDVRSSYYGEKNPNYHQYYVELIVRYPELKASGMDQDILDSFSGLARFFSDHLSPKIQEQTNELIAQQQPLDFSYE